MSCLSDVYNYPILCIHPNKPHINQSRNQQVRHFDQEQKVELFHRKQVQQLQSIQKEEVTEMFLSEVPAHFPCKKVEGPTMLEDMRTTGQAAFQKQHIQAGGRFCEQ